MSAAADARRWRRPGLVGTRLGGRRGRTRLLCGHLHHLSALLCDRGAAHPAGVGRSRAAGSPRLERGRRSDRWNRFRQDAHSLRPPAPVSSRRRAILGGLLRRAVQSAAGAGIGARYSLVRRRAFSSTTRGCLCTRSRTPPCWRRSRATPHVRTRLAGYREIVARGSDSADIAERSLAARPRMRPRPGASASSVVVFGAAIVVSGLVAFFATADALRDRGPRRATSHGLRAQLATLAGNRPLAWLSASFLCVNVGDAVFSGALVYYLTRILGESPAAIGTLYPVSSITGILVAPLWWRAANRLGKIPVCRVALALNAICCLLPAVDHPAARSADVRLHGALRTCPTPAPVCSRTPWRPIRRTSIRRARASGARGRFSASSCSCSRRGSQSADFSSACFSRSARTHSTASGSHEPAATAILLTFTLASAAALWRRVRRHPAVPHAPCYVRSM